MKLHNYLDKEKILAAVKAKQPLTHDGAPFYIRPDLPTGVFQQRRSFNEVCSLLIQKSMRFHMAFPATISFSHDGVKHTFTKAEDVQALMRS